MIWANGPIEVINEQNIAKSTIILVYRQMNEQSSTRMRVVLIVLTMAKCFLRYNEHDIILFIDNIFHFVQARS